MKTLRENPLNESIRYAYNSNNLRFYCLKNRKDLLNVAIRCIRRGTDIRLYYFNSNGVYTEYIPNGIDEIKKCRQYCNGYLDERLVEDRNNGESIYLLTNSSSNFSYVCLPPTIEGEKIRIRLFRDAISSLVPNVNILDDLFERYNYASEIQASLGNTELHISSGRYVPAKFFCKYPIYDPCPKYIEDKKLIDIGTPMEVSNFIYKVGNPIIERETENQNKNTFDFVRIRLSIPSRENKPNRKQFIKVNMRHIVKVALCSIDDTKEYKKYGVPTRYLKLEKVVITRADELELLFGLKEFSKTNLF